MNPLALGISPIFTIQGTHSTYKKLAVQWLNKTLFSASSLKTTPKAIHFINEAYLHCKAIAISGEAKELVLQSYVSPILKDDEQQNKVMGLIISAIANKGFVESFIKAIAAHRFFEREKGGKVPA